MINSRRKKHTVALVVPFTAEPVHAYASLNYWGCKSELRCLCCCCQPPLLSLFRTVPSALRRRPTSPSCVYFVLFARFSRLGSARVRLSWEKSLLGVFGLLMALVRRSSRRPPLLTRGYTCLHVYGWTDMYIRTCMKACTLAQQFVWSTRVEWPGSSV